MVNEIDKEIHKNQTVCYTCGKSLDKIKYECPTCGEWQCSEECRDRHIKLMEEI